MLSEYSTADLFELMLELVLELEEDGDPVPVDLYAALADRGIIFADIPTITSDDNDWNHYND